MKFRNGWVTAIFGVTFYLSLLANGQNQDRITKTSSLAVDGTSSKQPRGSYRFNSPPVETPISTNQDIHQDKTVNKHDSNQNRRKGNYRTVSRIEIVNEKYQNKSIPKPESVNKKSKGNKNRSNKGQEVNKIVETKPIDKQERLIDQVDVGHTGTKYVGASMPRPTRQSESRRGNKRIEEKNIIPAESEIPKRRTIPRLKQVKQVDITKLEVVEEPKSNPAENRRSRSRTANANNRRVITESDLTKAKKTEVSPRRSTRIENIHKEDKVLTPVNKLARRGSVRGPKLLGQQTNQSKKDVDFEIDEDDNYPQEFLEKIKKSSADNVLISSSKEDVVDVETEDTPSRSKSLPPQSQPSKETIIEETNPKLPSISSIFYNRRRTNANTNRVANNVTPLPSTTLASVPRTSSILRTRANFRARASPLTQTSSSTSPSPEATLTRTELKSRFTRVKPVLDEDNVIDAVRKVTSLPRRPSFKPRQQSRLVTTSERNQAELPIQSINSNLRRSSLARTNPDTPRPLSPLINSRLRSFSSRVTQQYINEVLSTTPDIDSERKEQASDGLGFRSRTENAEVTERVRFKPSTTQTVPSRHTPGSRRTTNTEAVEKRLAAQQMAIPPKQRFSSRYSQLGRTSPPGYIPTSTTPASDIEATDLSTETLDIEESTIQDTTHVGLGSDESNLELSSSSLSNDNLGDLSPISVSASSNAIPFAATLPPSTESPTEDMPFTTAIPISTTTASTTGSTSYIPTTNEITRRILITNPLSTEETTPKASTLSITTDKVTTPISSPSTVTTSIPVVSTTTSTTLQITSTTLKVTTPKVTTTTTKVTTPRSTFTSTLVPLTVSSPPDTIQTPVNSPPTTPDNIQPFVRTPSDTFIKALNTTLIAIRITPTIEGRFAVRVAVAPRGTMSSTTPSSFIFSKKESYPELISRNLTTNSPLALQPNNNNLEISSNNTSLPNISNILYPDPNLNTLSGLSSRIDTFYDDNKEPIVTLDYKLDNTFHEDKILTTATLDSKLNNTLNDDKKESIANPDFKLESTSPKQDVNNEINRYDIFSKTTVRPFITPTTVPTPLPFVIYGIFPNNTVFRKYPDTGMTEIVDEKEIARRDPYFPDERKVITQTTQPTTTLTSPIPIVQTVLENQLDSNSSSFGSNNDTQSHINSEDLRSRLGDDNKQTGQENSSLTSDRRHDVQHEIFMVPDNFTAQMAQHNLTNEVLSSTTSMSFSTTETTESSTKTNINTEDDREPPVLTNPVVAKPEVSNSIYTSQDSKYNNYWSSSTSTTEKPKFRFLTINILTNSTLKPATVIRPTSEESRNDIKSSTNVYRWKPVTDSSGEGVNIATPLPSTTESPISISTLIYQLRNNNAPSLETRDMVNGGGESTMPKLTDSNLENSNPETALTSEKTAYTETTTAGSTTTIATEPTSEATSITTTKKPTTHITMIKPKKATTTTTSTTTKRPTTTTTTATTAKPTTSSTTTTPTTPKPISSTTTKKPTTHITMIKNPKKATTTTMMPKATTKKPTTTTKKPTTTTKKPSTTTTKKPSTTTLRPVVITPSFTPTQETQQRYIDDILLLNTLLQAQAGPNVSPKTGRTQNAQVLLANQIIELALLRASTSTSQPKISTTTEINANYLETLISASQVPMQEGPKKPTIVKLNDTDNNEVNELKSSKVQVPKVTTTKPNNTSNKNNPPVLSDQEILSILLNANAQTNAVAPSMKPKTTKKTTPVTTTPSPSGLRWLLQALGGRNNQEVGSHPGRETNAPSPIRIRPQIAGVALLDDTPPKVVAEESPVETQPGLLNAAINVTRAVSQFMGIVIQGAAESFQNYIRQRTGGFLSNYFALGVANPSSTQSTT